MRSTYDLDLGADVDWLVRASCRSYDPEWWSVPNQHNRRAKAICGGCPVKRQCQVRAEELGITGMVIAGKSVLESGRTRQAPGTSARCARVSCSRVFWRVTWQQRFCSNGCRYVERNRRVAERERANGR